MLETLVLKAWNGAFGKDTKTFRWLHFLRPGTWIVIAVIILFGGRIIWIQEGHPAHRREITDAFGAMRMLYGKPQVSHDGGQFTFVATSDKGYALFISDTATGHKQIVCEESDLGALGDEFDLHAWPWSSDDSSFVYSAHGKLFIYSTSTHETSASLEIDANAVSDMVWVNPMGFAYVIGETNLCYAQRQPSGQWKLNALSQSTKDRLLCLTAITTNVIAWLQKGFICRANLQEDMTGTNNPWNSLSTDNYVNPPPPTNALVLWLDASTLHQADQTPVIGLADLSSQKNDAIPLEDFPSYNSPDGGRGLNGKGTIHFASNGSITNATGLKTRSKLGITGSAPRTVFAVMHRDDGRQMIINLGDAIAKGDYFGICAYNFGICLADACGLTSAIQKSSIDWNILEVVYNGDSQKGYINGSFESSTTYPLSTVDKEVEIGIRTANPKGENATASDGDFAELLIYNQAANDTERQKAEEYLNVKWFGGKLLSAQNKLVWFDPKLIGITGFNYSRATGKFLLCRTENDRDSLWRFEPEMGKSGKLSQIAEADSIRDSQWIGTKDCAYLSLDFGHKSMMLTDSSGTKKVSLLEHGSIDWFQAMPDGKQLLFQGMVNNEPSDGIWEYDMDSEQSRAVVPYSDHPSTYVKGVDPFYCSVELPSGHKLNYLLYPPANFNRHKKYPLVIGSTPFWAISRWPHGRPWLPGIATCGAFVVSVDRPGWFEGIEQWGDNVMMVYQNLIKSPCIDAQRVYLFSSSAETQYMGEFMAKSPSLWRGGILLNPTQLPDFSNSPMGQQRPKILISAGGKEHEDVRLKKYQEEALKSGALVDVIIAPGEGHRFVGNAAQLQRLRALARFIFEE